MLEVRGVLTYTYGPFEGELLLVILAKDIYAHLKCKLSPLIRPPEKAMYTAYSYAVTAVTNGYVSSNQLVPFVSTFALVFEHSLMRWAR
jgi:hypothetical protein